MQLHSYWVDGHYIVAVSLEDARNEAKRLYNYEPTTVRPWQTLRDVS